MKIIEERKIIEFDEKEFKKFFKISDDWELMGFTHNTEGEWTLSIKKYTN